MPNYQSYTVVATSFIVKMTRGPAGPGGNVLRVLRLQGLTQVGAANLNLSDDSGVDFTFYTKAPVNLGSFTTDGFVHVRTELHDFDNLYAIVRSAPEVIFTWKEDQDKPGVIVLYNLICPEAEMGNG